MEHWAASGASEFPEEVITEATVWLITVTCISYYPLPSPVAPQLARSLLHSGPLRTVLGSSLRWVTEEVRK